MKSDKFNLKTFSVDANWRNLKMVFIYFEVLKFLQKCHPIGWHCCKKLLPTMIEKVLNNGRKSNGKITYRHTIFLIGFSATFAVRLTLNLIIILNKSTKHVIRFSAVSL